MAILNILIPLKMIMFIPAKCAGMMIFIGMIRGGMDGMALIGTEVLIGMQDGGMTHGTTRGIMAGTDLGGGITLDIGMVLITGHM